MTRRPNRAVIWAVALAALGTAGLGLALGLGLPDPGTAERSFAGLIGLLGCMVAFRWLRGTTDERGVGTRAIAVDAGRDALSTEAPAVAASKDLARALDLGVETIGAFTQMVLPRLKVLAATKLANAGCSPDDRDRASELLGDGWSLVDPAAPRPADRMSPGVSLARVARLVETLEKMP
jgi:hypothetical protein